MNNIKRACAVLIVSLIFVLGNICSVSADSMNITEVNSLGETTFTIPAGDTTCYLIFFDSMKNDSSTYVGELTGVASTISYSFAAEDASRIEAGKAPKESKFYVESEKKFESDGILYFTRSYSWDGSRRTILKFELAEPQSEDVNLSLMIREHKHTMSVNKDVTVNNEKHSVLTSEYGCCECGYAYIININALCAGYKTGSGSSTFEAYVPEKNRYMYDGTGDGFSAPDNYGQYFEKVRTQTDNIGTSTGKYIINDSHIAEYFGGVEHEYQYQVMNRIVINVPTDKRVYTYSGKNIVPEFTVEPENCSPKKGEDYTITLNGKNSLKMLRVGSYTLRATAYGDYYINRGKTTTFKVVPKKASIRIAAGKRKVTVKFATPVKSTGGDKYQIRYRKVKTKAWKTIKTTSQTKTVKSLAKGKKYEIQARAIKTINGVTYYGRWSTMKTSNKVK